MYIKPMQQYLNNILSTCQCGFSNGYFPGLFNYNDRKMVWKCR